MGKLKSFHTIDVHRDKSTPQGEGPVSFDGFYNTINKTVIDLLVGGLIHEICTDTIKGGYSASHEETSDESTGESCADITTLPTG